MKDLKDNLADSKEIFSALLKKSSSIELKKYIEQVAREDESFRLHFIIDFIEQSSYSSGEKYSILVDATLQLAQQTRDSSGQLNDQITKLIKQGRQWIELKNYLDAYFIAVAILKPCMRTAPLSGYAIAALDLFSDIEKSDAGFDLKEKIFHFLNENFVSIIPEIREKWLRVLIESAPDEGKLSEVLNAINNLIGMNRSQFGETVNEAEEELLLRLKLMVLEKTSRSEEVQRFIESHNQLPFFRLKLIEEKMTQRNFSEAKELIIEGKKADERRAGMLSSGEWNQLLLEIAFEEKDTRSIRMLSLQLFLSSGYDFKYFRMLKVSYDPGRWDQQLDRIVSHLRKDPSYSLRGIHVAAQIFIEEKAWGKLLYLIEKNANLEFAEEYFDMIKEKFPHELLDVYKRAIRRYAEKNMGTDAYRKIASVLKKLQALPGGREVVQSLAIELKVDYRQRKSFVTELNKIAL